VGALAWSWATTTLALDGLNGARQAAQAIIALILLGRLALARARRERNQIWVAYLVCMALAVPIWLLIDSALWAALERWD